MPMISEQLQRSAVGISTSCPGVCAERVRNCEGSWSTEDLRDVLRVEWHLSLHLIRSAAATASPLLGMIMIGSSCEQEMSAEIGGLVPTRWSDAALIFIITYH